MLSEWHVVKPLLFLCCCWQSESGGRPPSRPSCSCKNFLSDPSDAVKANGNKQNNVSCKFSPAMCLSLSERLHRAYLQNEELGRFGFAPSLLQPWHRTHVHTGYRREWSSTISPRSGRRNLSYCKTRLTNDGHEGVEVSDVETLPGNIDEELDHLGSLLFLRRLQKGGDVCLTHSFYWFSHRYRHRSLKPAPWECSNRTIPLGGSGAPIQLAVSH